jgi:hypothetical protein
MAKRPRGLYRIPGWAYVIDGSMAFDVTEADYRARRYRPKYDTLMPKEVYDEIESAHKRQDEQIRKERAK